MIRDRAPPVGIKPQQMTVARHTVEHFEAGAAAGRDEGLLILADQGFIIEAVIVGIEPQLRDLVGRATAGIGVIRRRDRAIGVPAADEIIMNFAIEPERCIDVRLEPSP